MYDVGTVIDISSTSIEERKNAKERDQSVKVNGTLREKTRQ